MNLKLAVLSLLCCSTTTNNLLANELNVTYQCFERATNKPVAASSVDLSTEEVICKKISEENVDTKTTEPKETRNATNYKKEPWEDLAKQTQEQVNVYPRNNPLAARRAINLARGSVISFNGGLRIYRPGLCMFTSAVDNPCLTHASVEGFQFQVPGGEPGWEQMNQEPKTITRVWISGDGRSILNTSTITEKQVNE